MSSIIEPSAVSFAEREMIDFSINVHLVVWIIHRVISNQPAEVTFTYILSTHYKSCKWLELSPRTHRKHQWHTTFQVCSASDKLHLSVYCTKQPTRITAFHAHTHPSRLASIRKRWEYFPDPDHDYSIMHVDNSIAKFCIHVQIGTLHTLQWRIEVGINSYESSTSYPYIP